MPRTERYVPWRFGTNTCTVPPLLSIYLSIYLSVCAQNSNSSFVDSKTEGRQILSLIVRSHMEIKKRKAGYSLTVAWEKPDMLCNWRHKPSGHSLCERSLYNDEKRRVSFKNRACGETRHGLSPPMMCWATHFLLTSCCCLYPFMNVFHVWLHCNKWDKSTCCAELQWVVFKPSELWLSCTAIYNHTVIKGKYWFDTGEN